MDNIVEIMEHLVKRLDTSECTKATCPASWSIYGYAPNFPSTVFFVAIFSISSLTFLAQGFLRRGWWGFGVPMIIGTLLEAIGYVSRIMLYNNPFSVAGFEMNVVLLTVAPAFLSAGIYVLLKQFCLIFGPQFSRIKPQFYTYLFVSCDTTSIVLQAIGGGMSATAQRGSNTLKNGTNIMIAGLSFQVVTLFVFAILAGDFFWQVYQRRHELVATASLRASLRFRLFVGSVVLSFTLIFIRCAYRIAELEGGWGNKIMRDEGEFIALESVMITLAAVILNIFHPGFCFQRQHDTAGYEMHSKNIEIDLESMISRKR